ncbi:hypothetical protein PIB30_045797 [Stylosanthes scabra]|uniref:Uncharacterized protein n=1 Tax=Stylosanthes scabra TaxID=79078 RepID=A0ABU6ZF10_9FABA|nr:hypothetical protein [Stylosanthes scabra]
MQGASAGTTLRFNQYMPTPRARGINTSKWPMPRFIPPARTNSSKDNNTGGSSGNNNSTPNNNSFAPKTVLQFDVDAAAGSIVNGFEATSSFSILSFQLTPRGNGKPFGRAFFLSGPILSGAMCGPLEDAAIAEGGGPPLSPVFLSPHHWAWAGCTPRRSRRSESLGLGRRSTGGASRR